MAISIVSLAWDGFDLTRGFLQRLKENTDIEHELIFTDNGSKEPIMDLVHEYYPKAKLIRYEENIGCPATRNPSMEHVTNDIVFWLDNDTYVGPGWYKPFLTELEKDKKLGIVGSTGLRVRKPFDPGNPWKTFAEYGPNPFCDWFVGYAVAFRSKYYAPVSDWNLKVNMDDVDLGVGIKINGGLAKVLPVVPNLEHLTSQTSLEVRPTPEVNLEVMKQWWDKYNVFDKYFEEYK